MITNDYDHMHDLMHQQREIKYKIDLLNQYNRGPRFGNLFINGELFGINRADYEMICAMLRAKYGTELRSIEALIAEL